MGKSKTPKYDGLSKEEVTKQQEDYNNQISLLSQKNADLQAKYDQAQKGYEEGFNQKIGLLSSQLEQQKGYYDSLMGLTNESLAKSEQQTQATQAKYDSLNQAQEEQLKRVQAERERSSLMNQEGQMRLGAKLGQKMKGLMSKKQTRASLLKGY